MMDGKSTGPMGWRRYDVEASSFLFLSIELEPELRREIFGISVLMNVYPVANKLPAHMACLNVYLFIRRKKKQKKTNLAGLRGCFSFVRGGGWLMVFCFLLKGLGDASFRCLVVGLFFFCFFLDGVLSDF